MELQWTDFEKASRMWPLRAELRQNFGKPEWMVR